jgi:GT2 family glycosyltransferase
MRASVIVPVWNGGAVIDACLGAVFARSGTGLAEVVCVDNASRDDSAAIVRARHPRARLIAQPVNLGFAGGVNAGVDAADGDVLVLLNQDTVVEDGWLDALLAGLGNGAAFGIAGATILDAHGGLNHAGAFVRRPDAEGVHVTTRSASAPHAVDYVTGAAMAITRGTWETVGRFDEGYYPAYYEDCDYCYRAGRHGIRTGYVPAARVVHLQDSVRPARDPIRIAADHHFVRYRFVAKHWETPALAEFFDAEQATLARDADFPRLVGRVLAARDLLRRLDDVLAARLRDLGAEPTPARRRQLQIGFASLLRLGMTAAERESAAGDAPGLPSSSAARRSLAALKDEEAAIVAYLARRRAETEAAPAWRRWVRHLVVDPLRSLAGRDRALLQQLLAIHGARLDALEVEPAGPRLRLLRVLAEYDDR